MTLTKANIFEAVAKGNGYTIKRSVEMVEILLEIIKNTLESGEDVLISGLASFVLTKRRNVRFGTFRLESL